MANKALTKAKNAKKDEFYTQLPEIQAEINAYLDYDPDVFRGKTVLLPCDDPEWSNFTRFFAQNFERFGLKKLISTSYAPESKSRKYGALFTYASEQSDKTPQNERGKIFVLDHDTNANGRIDFEDVEWSYLRGDGDFRSDEVRELRDEADIIVTNPPFSLFREFLSWIVETDKKFLIIGNINCVSYKEVFPLIRANRLWLGESIHSGDREFGVPKDYPLEAAGWRVDEKGNHFIRVKGVRWFTNLEHGQRHSCAYNADAVWMRVEALYEDDFVTAKKGIFEYILGGEKDTKLLNVRVFSKKDTKTVYARQTSAAQKKGTSNCPLCAIGHEVNKTKIWAFEEMDADHVTAWSKGGTTDIRNCQMLCKTHNRAKGNH